MLAQDVSWRWPRSDQTCPGVASLVFKTPSSVSRQSNAPAIVVQYRRHTARMRSQGLGQSDPAVLPTSSFRSRSASSPRVCFQPSLPYVVAEHTDRHPQFTFFLYSFASPHGLPPFLASSVPPQDTPLCPHQSALFLTFTRIRTCLVCLSVDILSGPPMSTVTRKHICRCRQRSFLALVAQRQAESNK